jgi:hypothetical protein
MLAGKAHTHTVKPKDAISKYLAKIASAGGKARKKKLSAERRKQIARKAARTRWKK